MSKPWDYEEHSQGYQPLYGSAWAQDGNDIFNVRRSPAILRTNRQIYNEASSLFYSELRVYLQPGDVVWMAIGKDIVKPRKTQWTFNALDDTLHPDLSGSTLHPKPEADAVMGPHVLAQFKNITFETDFSWEILALDAYRHQVSLANDIALDENKLDQIAPELFISTIRTVNLDAYARHDITFYRHSKFVDQLVEVLSQSSDIIRFNMLFDVRVVAHHEYDFDVNLEESSKRRKMMEAWERAKVCFLQSGVLTPLEKLSNVKSISFRFASEYFGCEFCELEPKNHSVLDDLKQKIERKYAVRNTV